MPLPPVRRKALVYVAADGTRRARAYEEQGGVALGWPDDVERVLETFTLGDFVYSPAQAEGAEVWAAGPVTGIGDDGRLRVYCLGRHLERDAARAVRVPEVPRLDLTSPRSDLFRFCRSSERECLVQVVELADQGAAAQARERPQEALELSLAALALIASWGGALVETARRLHGSDSDLAPAHDWFRDSALQPWRRTLETRVAGLLATLAERPAEASVAAESGPAWSRRLPVGTFFGIALVVLLAGLCGALGLATRGAAGTVAGLGVLGAALGTLKWLQGHGPGWAIGYGAALAAGAGGMAHYLARGLPDVLPEVLALQLAFAAFVTFAAALATESAARYRAEFLWGHLPILAGAPLLSALAAGFGDANQASAARVFAGLGTCLGAVFATLLVRESRGELLGPALLHCGAVVTGVAGALMGSGPGWVAAGATGVMLLAVSPRLHRRAETALLALPAMAAPAFVALEPGAVGWVAFAALSFPFVLADAWWPGVLARLAEALYVFGRHEAAARLFDSVCGPAGGGRVGRGCFALAAANCDRLGDHPRAARWLERIADFGGAGEAYLRGARQLPVMPAAPEIEPATPGQTEPAGLLDIVGGRDP